MDQGNDAVYVREIINRGQILLVGPETNISGLFNGVIWYYLLAIGYIIFSGHPASAVVLLILLNLAFLTAAMRIVSKKISPRAGLFLGVSLSIFWWFYDTSRYGFNPFPLVALSVLTIFFLVDYLEHPNNQLIWASILTGLAFHAEVAGFSALFIFYFLFILYLVLRKKLGVIKFLLSVGIVILFFFFKLIFEIQNDFSGLYKIQEDILSKSGVFSKNSFSLLTSHYFEMVTNVFFPQNKIVAVSLLCFTLVAWVAVKKRLFVKRFFILTVMYIFISLLWFGLGTGWRIWHSVAIPCLGYIGLLLIAFDLPKKIGVPILTVILISQAVYFKDLYVHFSSNIGDQSILRNELSAIDWVYQKSQGQGFYVYNYVPSVEDFQYQYLFWWYGIRKYGYVPCEYGRYPGVPSFYVPGYSYYQKPQKPCAELRFLVIEPDRNESVLSQWYQGVTEKTKLLEKAHIGKITVEKRIILP